MVFYWLKGKRQDHVIRIESIAKTTVLAQMVIAMVFGLLFGLYSNISQMLLYQCSILS
jgi:hypothetical protein